MYNIKQYTNFSPEIRNAPEVPEVVHTGGDVGQSKEVTYKLIDQTLLKNDIQKFGYCCEPKALQYPIFLTIIGQDGPYKEEFQIGKTGMLEIQPEIWMDVNDDDPTEEEANPSVLQIEVPWYWNEEPDEILNFKLDFIYNIN